MSYDVGLYIHTGLEEVEILDCGNYTYNVSPMYYKALVGGLNSINGVIAKDAVKPLNEAINHIEVHAEEYQLLNPPNGWGNYLGALNFLKDIQKGCIQHPETIVRIF